MVSKVTNILLVSAVGERIFPIDVAEELLSWPKSGWLLPEGNGYEYSGGRLVRRRNEAETKAKTKE